MSNITFTFVVFFFMALIALGVAINFIVYDAVKIVNKAIIKNIMNKQHNNSIDNIMNQPRFELHNRKD